METLMWIVYGLMILSPFILLDLNFKKTALLNGIIVLVWVASFYHARMYTLFVSNTFIVTLVLSIIFLIFSFTLLASRKFHLTKRQIDFIFILAILTSFLSHTFLDETFRLFDLTLYYFSPIYVLLLIIAGIMKKFGDGSRAH